MIMIVLGLIIASTIYFLKAPGDNSLKSLINSIISDSEKNNENPPQEFASNGDESEISDGSGNTKSSSSGSGTGSGGSESSENNNGCFKKQISYSLVNPKTNSTCNEYDGEICIDKTIKCSVEINNRDQEFEGIFKVEMDFVEKGKDRATSLIETRTKETRIPPLGMEVFEETLNLQSTGQDGIANKGVDCFYNTLENPYAEIC
jgi:hypothetical protein